MNMLLNRSFAAAAVAAAMATALPATASDVTLPGQMTWTNYGNQSLTYASSIAIGEILNSAYGVEIQVIPVNSGYARVLPLISGRADMMLTGVEGYFAQEGVFAFAKAEAGPIPLQLVLYNEIQPGNGVVAAGDVGIETPADLAGKRVTYLQGSPSSNKVVEATLAFAGLTWDDVIRVPVSSFSDAHEAIINGQADAAAGNMVSGSIERIMNSPRGITWAPTPHDDEEGWARLTAVAPYIAKAAMSEGIGVPEGETIEFNGYGFPAWLAMASADDEWVYNLVKGMDEQAETVASDAPNATGYGLDQQRMIQSWPWHAGAVRYFEEKGIWTDEAEAHNAMMLKRQEVLQTAWDAFMAGSPPSGEEAFATAWGEARAAALEAAGLPPIYDDIFSG